MPMQSDMERLCYAAGQDKPDTFRRLPLTTLRSGRRLLLLAVLALMSMPFLAACGSGGDNETAPAATEGASPTEAGPTSVEIKHFGGTDTFPVKPKTVAVFDLGVFMSLNSLGVEVDALGGLAVPLPADLKAAIDKAKMKPVGTAFEPDYEAVNALEPDLIIVAGRSSRAYAEMKKIAPTIDLTIDEANFLESFRERHKALGQIFGVEEKVNAELARLDAAIADVKAKSGSAGDALIVMTNGAEVSAYGPGSRFGLLHEVFGYKAAEESLQRDATHGDVISFEFILKAAPDVMFVIDRSSAVGQDGEAAKKVLDNKLVAQTPAWKNNRVVYVDGFSWYIASNSLPSLFKIVEDAKAGLS